MNKEEIEQIQFEQTKSLLFQLQEANNKIEKIKAFAKIQKEIIKEQPSESQSIDKYVLEVLDGFLSIIDEENK